MERMLMQFGDLNARPSRAEQYVPIHKGAQRGLNSCSNRSTNGTNHDFPLNPAVWSLWWVMVTAVLGPPCSWLTLLGHTSCSAAPEYLGPPSGKRQAGSGSSSSPAAPSFPASPYAHPGHSNNAPTSFTQARPACAVNFLTQMPFTHLDSIFYQQNVTKHPLCVEACSEC